MKLATRTAAALTIAAIAVAGCGSKKNDTATTGGGATASATVPAKDFRTTAVLPVGKNTKVEPTIPSDLTTLVAPPRLLVDDVVTGKGKSVKTGDSLTVDYVGVSYSTGKVFDASWGKAPFPFTVGSGVIQGWSLGVVGMKAGGRRTLIIPPDLGYGPPGSPPAIAPNATLVFVIDLRKIDHSA